MAKLTNTSVKKETPKTSRPGVVAKTKASRSKNAKNYLKRYRGQGR